MQDKKEIFVDGIGRIHFAGGMVRFDFVTLQPEVEGKAPVPVPRLALGRRMAAARHHAAAGISGCIQFDAAVDRQVAGSRSSPEERGGRINMEKAGRRASSEVPPVLIRSMGWKTEGSTQFRKTGAGVVLIFLNN